MRRRTAKNKELVKCEVSLGKELFFHRGQRSEVSGQHLGEEYSHVFASHILTKGAYPRFRLNAKNIVLMSFEEHQLWENYKHKIRNDPKWDWVFKLEEILKREYYKV